MSELLNFLNLPAFEVVYGVFKKGFERADAVIKQIDANVTSLGRWAITKLNQIPRNFNDGQFTLSVTSMPLAIPVIPNTWEKGVGYGLVGLGALVLGMVTLAPDNKKRKVNGGDFSFRGGDFYVGLAYTEVYIDDSEFPLLKVYSNEQFIPANFIRNFSYNEGRFRGPRPTPKKVKPKKVKPKKTEFSVDSVGKIHMDGKVVSIGRKYKNLKVRIDDIDFPEIKVYLLPSNELIAKLEHKGAEIVRIWPEINPLSMENKRVLSPVGGFSYQNQNLIVTNSYSGEKIYFDNYTPEKLYVHLGDSPTEKSLIAIFEKQGAKWVRTYLKKKGNILDQMKESVKTVIDLVVPTIAKKETIDDYVDEVDALYNRFSQEARAWGIHQNDEIIRKACVLFVARERGLAI